ncbi:tyrosine--tRNA ligase [Candidatus Margulisiibacteriota bacterium]
MDPKRQLEIIKEGCVELLPEKELLDKLKRKKQLRIKWGADPSAPDLHLGHTVVIKKLRDFQQLGHKIVFIIGDFTGMIGDPSGKSDIRKPLTSREVKENARTYKDQIFKVLDPKKTEIVFNSKWLRKLTLEDVINLAGKYTVARMLERDDFIKRYTEERPISIHEFLYPLIQGYDSVKVKADVEIGGTDQKFNLLVGRELQREFNVEPQVIMTMPLLEGTDGVQKMSKSLNNYIGITEPAGEIFGKTMSIPDNIMIKYFELLSGLPLSEVNKIKEGLYAGTLHPKEIKKRLARFFVALYHSKDAALKAEKEFEAVFKDKGLPAEIPIFYIDKKELDTEGDIWLAKAMVVSGLSSSSSEAVRLIEQGAVKIEEAVVNDRKAKIKITEDELLLKVGKRKFMKIKRK